VVREKYERSNRKDGIIEYWAKVIMHCPVRSLKPSSNQKILELKIGVER